jgi:hypothetical protein
VINVAGLGTDAAQLGMALAKQAIQQGAQDILNLAAVQATA